MPVRTTKVAYVTSAALFILMGTVLKALGDPAGYPWPAVLVPPWEYSRG